MQMNDSETVDRTRVDEAASRAARRVYHTGQGQDEHAPLAASTPCRCTALTRRGHGEVTRTGSRGRGGGLRQTLDRKASAGRLLTGSLRDDAGTALATPLES